MPRGHTRSADSFYARHPRPGSSFNNFWQSNWREHFEDLKRLNVLAAEMALQAQDYLKAATEYRKAAELSTSVEIARKATRVAFAYKFNADALISAKRWARMTAQIAIRRPSPPPRRSRAASPDRSQPG